MTPAGAIPAAVPSFREGSPEPWPSLYDYGLIGNQRTAALVGRSGSIDWLCLPRFDSPSVFARILDRHVGGYHRVAPTEPSTSRQEYVPATNLLVTTFVLDEHRRLAVTDLMPCGPRVESADAEPRILRRLTAFGGDVPVEVVADPRFDYGRLAAEWRLDGTLGVATSPAGERLSCLSPWPWSPQGAVLRSTGLVRPETPEFAQIRWGDPPAPDPTPAALLNTTDAYWRSWVSGEDAPLRRVTAPWEPWVERSELVLKLLSHSSAGVFVAAPTTSLPEWSGGPRNWDYRYVWLRDAAFTAEVLLLLGHVPEARSYVRWVLARVVAEGADRELRTVYAVDGAPIPTETVLGHLEGYLGSRPVRVGNGASAQRQLDIYGEVLDAAALLGRVDPGFARDNWATLSAVADQAARLWPEPDSGIWEIRTEPAHYVHSKLMCWVALDRAVRMAEHLGRSDRVDVWRSAAEEVRTAILTRGFDSRLGAFVQAFDRPVLDASVLRIPLVGFLPPDDARVQSTLAAVEAGLANGPFVLRYSADDGFDSPEGSFLLCSFWLVESLARCGRPEDALARWRALLELGSPLKLFAEEYDPAAGRPLGNYPQAFTHIGVLRAALALGLVTVTNP